MRNRRLEVVGLVAVVAIALGVFLSNRNKGSDAGGTQALVPDLDLNKVASVRVEGGSAPFTLKKDGERWVIEEKSGYPADASKLRQLLLELHRARRVEQKTASPEGFEQLGVREPDVEGSESRALALLDAKGAELTRVIVGNRRFSKGAAQGPVRADEQHYVRMAGDEHAWLAAGKLTFETDPLRWLDQALFDVARDRVAAAEFARAEGEPLTVARGAKEEAELKPLAVPEGRTAKAPSGTAQALNALAGLRFDDVARAAEFEWPEQPDVTTTFWTFDGLKVSAESIDRDGKTWARFRAEVVDKTTRPGVPPETPTVGPPPLLAADAALEGDLAAEGDPAGDAPPKPLGPTPAELAAEAKKINDKVGDWVFAVPSWKASAFKLKLEDVLAPLPVPAVEEPVIEEPPIDEPTGGGEVDGGVVEDPPTDPMIEDPVIEVPPPTEPPPSDPVTPPPGAPGGGG